MADRKGRLIHRLEELVVLDVSARDHTCRYHCPTLRNVCHLGTCVCGQGLNFT